MRSPFASVAVTVDSGLATCRSARGVEVLWDVQGHRSKAIEYTRMAESAASRELREHYLRMSRSSLLLAKNAEWVKSTDEFLRDWRRHN